MEIVPVLSSGEMSTCFSSLSLSSPFLHLSLCLSLVSSSRLSFFIRFYEKSNQAGALYPSGPGTPLLNPALLTPSVINASFSGGLREVTLPPQLLESTSEQLTLKPTVEVTAVNTAGQGSGASQARKQDARSQPPTPNDLGLRQMGVGMESREAHLAPLLPPCRARSSPSTPGGRVRSLQVAGTSGAQEICKFIAPSHLPAKPSLPE